MKSNYDILGNHIRLIDTRNRESITDRVLGINIDKFFMPSVANVIGTDLSKYKLITKGKFACNPMHVGRDERLPVALYDEEEPAIVSPAYFMFEVVDNSILNEDYLMMWFRRPEFDRICWLHTDGSVRGGITWDDICRLELPIPPIEKQLEIVNSYKAITERITLKKKINHNFADEVCKFCGVSTTKYVNVDFNKTYSEVVPIPVSSLVIERDIIFNANKDGKYFFNISNLSDKVLIDATIMKNDIRNIHYVTECANKSFKKSYMLSKGDQLKLRIRGLNSTGEYYNQSTYKYYEPIKFNYKITCDHIYKNTVVKPTYVSGGYTLHKCSTCGYSYKDKKTAKLKLQKPNGLTVKGGKKSLTVSYKKVAKATGYQIQYSLYSNFKSVKTIKLTKNSITKKTITKLKRNKKYFVRIRSYVVQNKKTTYSSWTKSKKAKTK